MDEAIMKIIKKIAPKRTSPMAFVSLAFVGLASVGRARSASPDARRGLVKSPLKFSVKSPVDSRHAGVVFLLLCSPHLLAQEIFGSYSAFGDTSYKITMPGASPAFNWQSENDEGAIGSLSETRSEMLYKLSFYPHADLAGEGVESQWSGGDRATRICGLSVLPPVSDSP